MADTATNLAGVNELDELQKKFASQKFEDKENSSKEEQETEPKASEDSSKKEKAPTRNAEGRRVLFVASKSQVKSVAGVIARLCREEEKAPALSAVGASSVNQAIKAIAIARDFLKRDELDLSVQITREPQEDVKDIMVLTLTKHKQGTLVDVDVTDKENDNVVTMRAASKSVPKSFAGAIAGNVRDNKRVVISAIGRVPVFKASFALALTRKYLVKDSMDIIMYPKFTSVTLDDGSTSNAISMIISKTPIQSSDGNVAE